MTADERTTPPNGETATIQTPDGFRFTPGEEFLVAVQERYQIGQPIEVRGIYGKIIEQITPEEFLMVWAYRGFDSEAISLSPRFYYRCLRLGSPVRATPKTEVRGDQESGL